MVESASEGVAGQRRRCASERSAPNTTWQPYCARCTHDKSANDYTFRFQAIGDQIGRDSIRAGLRERAVRIEQRLDG